MCIGNTYAEDLEEQSNNCPDCDDAREYGSGVRVNGRRYCPSHFPVLKKCEELDVCEDCLFCKECHESCTMEGCQYGRRNIMRNGG